MDESDIAHKVASMRCLITFIKDDKIADAIDFVVYTSRLQGNPILSKMKHLILMTPDFDNILLKNLTTGNFNIYIISPIKPGMNKSNTWPRRVMQQLLTTLKALLGHKNTCRSATDIIGGKDHKVPILRS